MPDVETIAVVLPAELKRAVEESVETGEFADVNAAFRDAIRVWQRQRSDEALSAAKAHIRRSLDCGAASLTGEEARDRLRRFMDAREHDTPNAAR